MKYANHEYMCIRVGFGVFDILSTDSSWDHTRRLLIWDLIHIDPGRRDGVWFSFFSYNSDLKDEFVCLEVK